MKLTFLVNSFLNKILNIIQLFTFFSVNILMTHRANVANLV